MNDRERALAEKDPGVLRTKGLSRDEWVEQGRRLGADEARNRREIGSVRDERIRRAGEYAGWEWDGKPKKENPSSSSFRPDPKVKK